MRHLLWSTLLIAIPAIAGAQQPAYVLEKVQSQPIKAVLSFKVKHPKARAIEWYLFLPKAPETYTQSKVRTITDPAGVEKEDLSPEKRPMFTITVPARTRDLQTSVFLKVKFEAIVHGWKLRRRQPGEKAPVPVELSKEDRKKYLLAFGDMDYQSQELQKWLKEYKLQRNPAESEIDFGRRVFLTIRSHFKYDYRTKLNRKASYVCQVDKSDCGGLSVLFASSMRANGIPARVLYGRWAQSAKENEKIKGTKYYQTHALAEFYADGIGWVRVDPSAAIVHDHSKEGLTFFGKSILPFFTIHIDPNIQFNAVRFGNREVHAMQGPAYFIFGNGSAEPRTITQDWQVERGP